MTTLTANELRIQLAAARAEEAQRQAEASAPARKIAELEAAAAQAAEVEAAQRLINEADNTRQMIDNLNASAAPLYAKLTEAHVILQGLNLDAMLAESTERINHITSAHNRIKYAYIDAEIEKERAHRAEYVATYGEASADSKLEFFGKQRGLTRFAALNLPPPPTLNDVLSAWVQAATSEADYNARASTLQKVLPGLFGRGGGLNRTGNLWGNPDAYGQNTHAAPGPLVMPPETDRFFRP